MPNNQEIGRISWNTLVFLLSLLCMVFGAAIIFLTPDVIRDTLRKHTLQVILLTMILPILVFLLAMEKIPKEAGLAILGTIVGYAFGQGSLGPD